MRVQQLVFSNPSELARLEQDDTVQMVMVFGHVSFFETDALYTALKAAYPKSILAGCSTAGEVAGVAVNDNTCTVTLVSFDHCTIQPANTRLEAMSDSEEAGKRIAAQLPTEGLKALLVYGPGLNVNGSALVRGIHAGLEMSIPIAGGLAGDSGAFVRTYTLSNNGISDNGIVAVGLYGDALAFSYGCFGGWESFGPARKVTRCEGNVLYELDGEPALEVYKRYLGNYAKDLPASGLLFPLAMTSESFDDIGLTRTILGVDNESGSLTLAGEIDPDGYVRLMHASTEALVDGALKAAEMSLGDNKPAESTTLGIVVSCVGRKLVMGEAVDEEIEAVSAMLGSQTTLTGFYSYGEFSPFAAEGNCHLHNQTMTLACISEK